MAMPSTLWTDMNINPHVTRADYINIWGDCQEVTSGGGVSFYTKHYTALTQQHYADENPTFQAMAAREAALAHKIDKVIETIPVDLAGYLQKDVANDANLYLLKASNVGITAETTSGESSLTAKGTTQAILNLYNGSNSPGSRWLRFRNHLDEIYLDRLTDAGVFTSSLFRASSSGDVSIGRDFYSMASPGNLGATTNRWGNLYMSGNVDNDWIPNQDINYDLGTALLKWGNLHLNNLYLYGRLRSSIIPNATHDLGALPTDRFGTLYSTNIDNFSNISTSQLQVGYLGISSHLIPNGVRDLGSLSLPWRNLALNGEVIGDLHPVQTDNYSLGRNGRIWLNMHCQNLYVYSNVHSSLIPIGIGVQSLGDAINYWLNMYATNTYTQSLHSWGGSPTYITMYANNFRSNVDDNCNLGSTTRKWSSVHAHLYDPFTGSHYSVVKENEKIKIEPGMIAVTTGKVYIEDMSDTIVEVSVPTKEKDTGVYGIFRAEIEDILKGEEDEDRELLPLEKLAKEGRGLWYVNALGEGQMAVVKINPNGPKKDDLLITSDIPGYATVQEDDIFHTYTIGKVTQDIDWNKVETKVKYKGKSYKKTLIAVTYHCG